MKHGNSNSYGNHGCRCDECRAWKAAANRRYQRGEVAYRRPQRVDLDDVDEIAVERACRGGLTVTLNRAERDAAFQYLDDRGYTAKEIGRRLGVSMRTVQRWRAGLHRPVPLERAA